jgi:Fe2+ transport system protein FeoA
VVVFSPVPDPVKGVAYEFLARRKTMKRLKECPERSQVEIVSVVATGQLKRRLLEMGLLPGQRIKVVRNAPLRDPMELEVMGYLLSLRKDEAAYILVREDDHE